MRDMLDTAGSMLQNNQHSALNYNQLKGGGFTLTS